jgi:hypothetical protein
MTAALLLCAYALIVAWSASVLLTPLTSRGISARLGLTAWLTAMASVLVCLGTALVLLVRAAVTSWPGFAADVCRSVAGQACTPLVYRGVFEFGLSAVALVATVTATVLAWRYGRHVQRAQQGTRAHAEAARVTGRRLPGIPGFPAGSAVVLDSAQRVAYCVPGRPAAIVLSTGALAILDTGRRPLHDHEDPTDCQPNDHEDPRTGPQPAYPEPWVSRPGGRAGLVRPGEEGPGSTGQGGR